MEEIWKYYDETHKVSSLGRVMWFDGIDWKFNKIYHDKGGHPSISIHHQPKPIKRLVAQLFVDNPNGMPYVVNIDGDKNNCTAANLKWISANELGSYQGDKSLQYDDVVSRIKEAKGDTYQMVGTYEQLCKPMRFKCGICGNEFDETPQHVIIYGNPCPHCKREEIEQRRDARQREIEQERANRMANLPNLREHVVYAYIFNDGHAYVGLTCNQKSRDHSHRCNENSAVYLHSKETGASIPSMTILEQGLTPKEAQHYEGLWLKWMSNTFTMLNRAKTGGLGGLFGNVPHTIENALKAKEKFKTRHALRWHCFWAWEMLKEKGLLPPSQVAPMSLGDALKIKQEYKTRKEILKGSYTAYYVLKEHGLLPEIKSRRKYTIEEALREREKFPTKKELRDNAMWAYSVLQREGMLPPGEEQKRTIEEAKRILTKYHTRSEIKRHAEWAFDLLAKDGLLPPKGKHTKRHGRRRNRTVRGQLSFQW